MAWFTAGDIDDAIGRSVREAVAETPKVIAAAEERARKRVQAAYLHSGYTISDTAPSALAKSIAIALWITERYGASAGMSIPDNWRDMALILNGIWSGEYPDPDATVDTVGGIGGSRFSSTSETSTGGRPQRFNRSELKSW